VILQVASRLAFVGLAGFEGYPRRTAKEHDEVDKLLSGLKIAAATGLQGGVNQSEFLQQIGESIPGAGDPARVRRVQQ
jgi:hypothetical protein